MAKRCYVALRTIVSRVFLRMATQSRGHAPAQKREKTKLARRGAIDRDAGLGPHGARRITLWQIALGNQAGERVGMDAQ